MKKFLAFVPVLSFALALLVLGCENPSVPDGTGSDQPDTGKMAKVVISLPFDAPLSRVGVPIEDAKQFADRYEVFFTDKSSGVVIEASAARGDNSITVEMSEGTYDILLLATENQGTVPLVLASSYALNKPILADETNEVRMEMKSIYLDIIALQQVPVLLEYDVGFTFNPQNPLLTSPDSIRFSVNNESGNGIRTLRKLGCSMDMIQRLLLRTTPKRVK